MYGEGELLQARRDYADTFLTHVADVRRKDSVSDGGGGNRHVPVNVEAGLRGRVRQLRNPRTGVEGGVPVTIADYEIRLCSIDAESEPDALEVKPADEIAIGGQLFRVVSTSKGRTDALCLVVEAIRVS